MNIQEPPLLETELDARLVEDYLRQHPDFFLQRDLLLSTLQLTHSSHGAISLIERQVKLLREQNQRYQRQLKELLQIARDNDHLSAHMQALSLRLLESADINDVLLLLNKTLCEDFSADAVSMYLAVESNSFTTSIDHKAIAPVAAVCVGSDAMASGLDSIIQGEIHCGPLNDEQKHILFGEQAQDILSAVVLPLSVDSPLADQSHSFGLLAIGSEQEERYYQGMGTVFLDYLAAMLGRKLWLLRQQA